MKKLTFTLLSTLILCCTTVHSQTVLSGGGDLNPDLKAPIQAQQKWQDMRVGLSVHWGPSSIGGKEIGWSRGTKIPVEIYDQFYKEFNPHKFDAEQWCQLLNRWGVKYISPTAKHHDGFALWFSEYSPYDMKKAARKIDIMDELKRECEKHGIVLGAYYSNIDWFHPDWAPYEHGGPGKLIEAQSDSPNLDRYFDYMEKQVCELITKYDLAFVQFDGEWTSTYTHEVGSKFYRKFHEAKPDVLLSTRIDIGRRSAGKDNHTEMDGAKYAGDFQDRERLVSRANSVTKWGDHPWQAWVTIDKNQWSYSPAPTLMMANELIKDMIHVVGNNGNYMINLGPKPDGTFHETQIALMDTLGMWLNKHQEMIYGTRGGPYYPQAGVVSTRKGNKAWIIVTDSKLNTIQLPNLSQKIRSAKYFDKKKNVKYQTDQNFTYFTIDQVENENQIRVIELTFNSDVEMCSTKPAQQIQVDKKSNEYY